MERKDHFFNYKNTSLHYSVYGSGDKPIFCFHGFGLTGTIFYELEELQASEYTFYNFDLPFHGQSKWSVGEEPISSTFWKEWLTHFCKEKNIDSFSLLGYSIGARLVWASVMSFPDRIKEVIVMAPDGIKNSFWYALATHTSFSRTLFKKALLRNDIQSILKAGRMLRLAPKLTVRFAESQLLTEEQRKRVYYTWVTFRKLKVDPNRLAQLVNQHPIELTIYLGAQDKIITYKTIEPLAKKLRKKNIVTLMSGHSNLIHKVVEYLKSLPARSY